ncbi:DNA primase [Leptolyngbya cf. ectocarpi LEGE 11479]|uniref:DNA primase n=1 Tax=Leptolyngbya cf. ectocarpi LEGE 11479 TaxID=1828722 RepID=A0A928ZT64_LEPEC|nr:DNA primase [Leptolyngbya ectocarpi]MBE9066506.1 DNA primase [Leptolyngbya cf. ectocarpi LEGE 11479]
MSSPRIHPDTIDDVRQRADIVDVVSEHVVLKKQGKDFTGLCPFHDDKSPSFSVSPSKQFYYCFSCGAGGNAFKFLMELGQQSFAEVVLDLARRYQVPVKTLEPAKQQEYQRKVTLREQLFEILTVTAKFYEHALYQSAGQEALEYLRSQRQFSDDILKHFTFGYAPDGWQALYVYLVEQKHYSVKLVEQAGLVVPNKNGTGYYDRFRNRVMVPIYDPNGRIIGFGGRGLGDEKPKYLNSPETELFDKSKTLYGLDKAKGAIAKQDRAIVVEGYFDVVALHAAGITNAVASLGTALNAGQVRQLLRYTESKQIVFNFDADAAGIKAAQRAIGEVAEMAHRGDVQLRILNIPDGKDPDDYLRTHVADEYHALVEAAPLWLDWQIQQTLQPLDLKQADQFQTASQDIVKLLADIANADTRTHYIRHCAEIFSQGDARLVPLLAENFLAQVRRQRRSPEEAQKKFKVAIKKSALEEAEGWLLRVYIHIPKNREAVKQALEERDLQLSFSHHRALWRMMLQWQVADDAQEPSPVGLLEQLRNLASESTGPLSQVHHLLYLDEKTQRDILRAPLIIRAAVACMEKTLCEKRYRYFLKLWEETDLETQPNECAYYHKQSYAEKKRIAELDQERQVAFEDLASLPWVGEFYGQLDG